MNKKEKNQTKNNRYDAENMQDRKQRRFKIHKRVWKKVTAILLVCTMMPFSDLAQADIYETLTKVYADEETQNTQEDSTVKLTLEGEMDGNANNILSWKQAEEVEELGEIKSYQIYRDGVKIAETTECTYTDTCTGAGETYCYQVQAEVETTTIFSNEIDLQMPEALVIDSDYRLEENMQVYCVDIQSGSLDLNGYNLEVCRDVNVNGMLKFNKGILVCGGDIRFQKGAECRMRYDDDYLYVGGDFRDEEFKRENTVAFENGKIVLKGNFKVNHGMLFRGTTLRFEGVKKQVIDCQSTMGSVVFNNVSDEGIEILGDLDRTSSINNESGCRVIWSDEIIKESVGWTLSEDMTIKDNLCITEGSLDLNGHTLNVQGDLSMLDGEINLNGGTLNVEGDMSFNQGTLNMNHGTLVVAQDFNCELYVFGGNNYRGYAQIIMNYEDDRIEIQGSCMLDSLGNISFANGVVEVEGALYIEGDIEIGNQFKAGFCRNDIGVLTISGMLEVESYNYGDGAGIDMDKGRMVVQERFGAGGMVNGNGLRMTHPEDYLCVYGDFDNMEFYDESTGYTIQSGTIELKGRSNSIYAYGDSKVVISGDVAQYVYGEAVNVEVRNSSVNEIDISYLTAENIEYIDVTPSYQGIALTSGWTLTEDTVINGDFALKEGVLDLNGHSLTVNGEFCHYGGTLQFNGGTCAITGDYTFVSENNKDEARLLMENPADYFKVGGNFCMQEYEVSNLIDGVLEIKGNICGYSIISSQNHKIVLSGEQEQKVECSTGYSQFHILESRNKSEEGIVLTGWYNIEQFIQNGNVVSYSFQEGNFGHTLQEDEVYEGDFYLADDELNLNGHTLHVKGDFIQNGGAIHIQNGHLIVDGDYKSVCGSNVWSGDYSLCGVKSGALSMQGEDSEITIKGSLFISIGNYAEWNLEAGRINVAGDMNIQSQPVITYGENFAFCFNGSIKQEISSKNRFTIQNIMFQNTRAQRGITCTSGNIIVSGNIYSNGICYVDNLRISETASLKDNNFWGSVYFLSDYVIEEGVSIRGSINGTRELKVNGTLILEGVNHIEKMDIVVNGTLNVKDSVSLNSVIVNGILNVKDSISMKSMIVNGTVNGGKIDIEGSLWVSGVMNQITDISLTEGSLTMENGSIYADSIQLMENAQISMTHADDYIKTGNLEYSSLKASELSDGILELTKDATLNCYFSTTGNHKMLLSGESEQSIIASRGKVILEQVEINQLEKAGVYIDYNVYIKKLLDKNNAQKLLLVDYILKEDLVIDEDVYLYAGKLDLNGHHLTVNGDFIYTDGYIKLSNGELEITGNYYNENPKGENIENPNLENVIKEGSNDYYGTVNIAGNVYLTGTDTDFQYNTVTIGGDIITNGSGMCIQSNTLTLTGKDVSIEKGALTSVTNLTLLCDSLKLENDLYIYGKFNPGEVVFDDDIAIHIQYLSQIETETICANLVVYGSNARQLTRDLNIVGNLTVMSDEVQVRLGTHKVTADSIDIDRGRVYVQSGTLISRGDLNISYLKFGSYCKQGMLLMQEQDGYVLVHGDFNIDYVNGYSGLLTAGTLEIRGDFNNKGNGYFCASESHKTIFSRNKTDDIQYIQKITKNKNNFSKFNTIVLTRRIDAGYQFDCDIEQMCNQLIYEYDDSTPPTAVTGLKVTDTTLTTVTLAYKEAADNTGFVRYRIYRNDEEIADLDGSVLTYTDTELTPGTEYIYTVESYDDCNNPCEDAPEVSMQTKTDTENPSAPTSLSVIKRSGSSITIRWNPAQDNVKIGGYELYRNGEKIADITEGVSYQDTGLSANTAYEYKVRAYDTSGNYSTFAQSVTSYVATPKIMEIIPADNEIFGGNSIHIIVFAKNYRAGDKYEAELLYRKKGEEYQVICSNLDMNHYYNWEMNFGGYIWNLTDLTEGGEYDIKCILRDEDGNTTERVVTYYLDREAPETPKQVEIKTDNGTNVIGFDASTSADCVGYRIYRKDADNTVFTLHDTLSGQFNVHYTDNQVVWGQEYTYAISAIDKFGNESALTEEITIATEEDQTPPQITGITPDDKRVNGVISVEVYASDNVGVNSIHLWYQSEEDSLREELAALTRDITQSGMAYTNAQMLLENGLTNSDTEYNRIYLGEVQAQNGTASFSFDTTKLEDGAYILKAVAVDASGNESEQDYTKRYEVDNTGISKIELADCTTSSTSAQLRWNDVEESDFAYFAVERVIEAERETDSEQTDTEDLTGTEDPTDGTNAANLTAVTTERIATVTNTLGYNITGLTPGTTYHFQVVGYDALGNRGIPSDVMELTTTDDTINPVINSILPVPSKYKNQIQLSMQVSDNYAISKGVFSYSLDGTDFVTLAEVAAAGKSSETISYTMDLSELPEGEVYIRFEAYDAAGNKNALLKDGSDVIATYQIDRTPPAALQTLAAEGKEGYIALTWEQGETDEASYTILRADEAQGNYQTLTTGHTAINYYDTNVTPGKTYYYQIMATDLAGNTGDVSAPISATALEDNELPEIRGISPVNGSITGKNPTIQVVATDNAGVANITVEYRQAEDESGVYYELATVQGTIPNDTLDSTQTGAQINNNQADRTLMLTTTFLTEGLPEGEYVIRAYCEDTSGNASISQESTIQIDQTAPDTPTLTCESGGYQVSLHIESEKGEDFAQYNIYRAELLSGKYEKLTSMTANDYIDTTAKPGILYCYKAEAVDTQGNSSASEVITSYATEEDTIAPQAKLTESITTLAGYEIALDGTASTDNIRIVSYEWSMGNGDRITGAQPTYTYDRAGTYSVTLTVKDAAGFTDSTTMAVQVLENEGNGTATITVTDTAGTPLAYADVYIKTPDGDIQNRTTDSRGQVILAAKEGAYEVAAYANGYLPNDKTIQLSRYYDGNETIVLESGDLIVGELKVEKMTLQEMVDAGVSLSDPANLNNFTFTVTVKLAQTPIPQTITYIGSTSEDAPQGELTATWSGGGGGGGDIGTGGTVLSPEIIPQAKQIVADEPIIAIISTTQTVSWLKEMYNVNLSILNAADTSYVIKDSTAELYLPDGVSLAVTKDGQSPVIDMGSIAGQQQKNASWVVKGDKTGTYQLEADFRGTLMPFNRTVNAHFETKKDFSVSTGEGLHIIISPEEAAYIDENYYIQFEIRNESDRSFYNFTTTLGAYQYEESRNEVIVHDEINGEDSYPEKQQPTVYTLPSGCTQMPVLQGGDQINIPVLAPGESIYGTYHETFDAEGDPYEVYYRLIETLVTTVKNDVTGVKISIQPIQSHLSRSIVTYRERKNYFADPVDLATGAFTDSIPVISVTGASELAFNLDYTSLLSGTQGETGRGFYHNFETHIEETDNRITLYLTAGISGTFVHEDTINGIYTGSVSKNNVYLNGGNSDGTYVSLSTATKKYSLYKHADGTYTVTTPAKDCYRYDSAGRCIQVTDDNGRETLISYEDASNSKTITEPVSGKHLYIHYNAEGMVTQVSDDNERSATFAYTDGNLTAYTNVLGETTTFTYDESNRILTETDCEGITYVTNTYDEAGRVVSQSDADTTKENMRISYEETTKEDGSTLTTVTAYDALGNKGVVVVDETGAIIQNIDNNGGVTEISYDKNGNEIFEKDALGATVTTEYDAAGRKIAVTDQSHITTRFTYDERDNLTAITDGAGNTATYVYNDKNLITKLTDYNGMVTTYEYNEYAQLVKKTVEGLGSCTYTYEKGMLVASTDYNGNTTTYTYDGTGAITSKTDALGNTTTYTHDAMLQETGQTDALGNTITYTYDKYGNRLSETDACGATTRYEYDQTGKQTAVILADGSRITYEYDAAGQVTKAISADGTATTYTYDANGNLLTETNEQGETITYTYDALNQRISETSASGNTIRYGYYPNGKPYVTEYPDGTRTLSTYDENWRLIRKTDTGNHSVTYEYDAMGNVTAERDALGNAIRYTYDNQGRVLSVTDKNGNITSYTYDGNGNCLTKQSADGTLLQFTYDALNQLVKAETRKTTTSGEVLEANKAAHTGVDQSDTDVDGSDTGATGSSVGQENGQEDSISPDTEIITVLFEYDALGRLIRQTDEEGGVTTYEYDACGRTTQVTDVLGNITTYEYDVLGNLIKATDATGAVSTYTYSNTGLLLESINAAETEEATTTTYTYDEAGRMLSVTDPLEGVVSCTYDVDGNVETVTDAMGGTTTYTYDTLGRLTSETSAIGSVQSYTYNAEGLLEKDTNARKQDTHYTYDALGRIIRMEDEAGTITYEYDANGNVLSVTEVASSENVGTENGTETDIVDEAVNSKDVSTEDGEATDEAATAETSEAKTITRTYDCMNRVTSYTDVNGRTIRYTYDELGNILSLTYPGGEIVRYTYYASGRMKSVTDSKGRVTYYTYDKAGNLTVTERPDGTKETNTYNAAGQLIAKTDVRTADNAVLSEYHYEYDTRGNIISVTGTGITGVCEAGNGISVSEDGSVSVAEESTAGAGVEESTGVDTEDSLTRAEETVGMDSSVSQAQAAAMAMSDAKMEYDADNRLISYNGEEVKYDADGNMIYGPLNGKMTSFTYDCRNRLIQADNTRYVYDAENTRIAVETETSRTEYVTDVVNELSQVLEVYVIETKEDDREGTEDAKSDKRTSETVERTIIYIYGNGLIYEYEDDVETAINASITDEEVSVSDNAETSDILVHHYNHIGSTMKLTNAQGEVVETYQYGTYGELLCGDAAKTAYLYNGMYGVATDENGLYYMRARYYNTDIKRFINRDVVKGSMENSQSLNRYSYVQGNPVSLTDPFGLSPFTWSNIGHGLLNALGMIPYIGEVFDLANAAWYMKEGNYAMAALSAISALPMLGNIASGALTMFKCAKAAKYVKTVSKVISNAATFGVAAAGGTKSIKNIYKNVKQGNVFTKENFAELANIGLSAFTMICSGKNTIASGKELGGMLKEDVPKAWSSVKKSFKTFAADNRGAVDLNAAIGNGTSSDVSWTNHRYKHFPDKGMSWKKVVKSTKSGPAKYHTSIVDIEAFEREAWNTGIPVTNGKNWKVKKYDTIIGATEGKETCYVRIECSADTIHGHPISESEYNKLLK